MSTAPKTTALDTTALNTSAPNTTAPKPALQTPPYEIDTIPMQEGAEFANFKAFKAAKQDWAVAWAHKFNFATKSDFTRNVVCAYDNCAFRINATDTSVRGQSRTQAIRGWPGPPTDNPPHAKSPAMHCKDRILDSIILLIRSHTNNKSIILTLPTADTHQPKTQTAPHESRWVV